jgi:hypothetical protein
VREGRWRGTRALSPGYLLLGGGGAPLAHRVGRSSPIRSPSTDLRPPHTQPTLGAPSISVSLAHLPPGDGPALGEGAGGDDRRCRGRGAASSLLSPWLASAHQPARHPLAVRVTAVAVNGGGEDHVWFEDWWMVASLCDD